MRWLKRRHERWPSFGRWLMASITSSMFIIQANLHLLEHVTNILHLAEAFIQSGLMNTFTHRWRSQPRKASGAGRVWCLAQGHLDTPLRGAGFQTSNLPVTSKPNLPPELSRSPTWSWSCSASKKSC